MKSLIKKEIGFHLIFRNSGISKKKLLQLYLLASRTPVESERVWLLFGVPKDHGST